MNAIYKISAVLCMFFCSCKQSPKKINLEIPENFQGVIHIYNSDKDEPKPIGDFEVKVVVPESGVAFTDQYEAFADWHQIAPISKNDTGKEFHLFGLGEVNKTHMIYFYGDVNVYENQISKISAFDLKPGRFP